MVTAFKIQDQETIIQDHSLSNSDGSGRPGAASPTMPVPAVRQVLMVLGAALGLASGFATTYFSTLSIFLKPVTSEFGWGRAEGSAAGVLSMLGLALGALLVGRLIDRFGPARVVSASVVLMASLTFLLSRISNSPLLFGILSFAIGIAGAATTPPGYLSVLARWFERRLGLALGLAGVGMGVGTILMPVIAQRLITDFGWRGAYIALAAGSLTLGMLACMLLFPRMGTASPMQMHLSGPTCFSDGDSLRQAARGKKFWAMVVIFFLAPAAVLGMSVHFSSMFTDRGLPPDSAATAVALGGLGVLIGRLGAGALLDLVVAPRVAAAAFMLAGIGSGLIALDQSDSFAVLAFAAFLGGIALGAEGDFMPFMVRRYYGLRSFGAIYGTLFCVFAVGGVTGPILFGLCFDRLGSYTPMLVIGAATCLCCAAGMLMLGSYRYGATGQSPVPSERMAEGSAA